MQNDFQLFRNVSNENSGLTGTVASFFGPPCRFKSNLFNLAHNTQGSTVLSQFFSDLSLKQRELKSLFQIILNKYFISQKQKKSNSIICTNMRTNRLPMKGLLFNIRGAVSLLRKAVMRLRNSGSNSRVVWCWQRTLTWQTTCRSPSSRHAVVAWLACLTVTTNGIILTVLHSQRQNTVRCEQLLLAIYRHSQTLAKPRHI